MSKILTDAEPLEWRATLVVCHSICLALCFSWRHTVPRLSPLQKRWRRPGEQTPVSMSPLSDALVGNARSGRGTLQSCRVAPIPLLDRITAHIVMLLPSLEVVAVVVSKDARYSISTTPPPAEVARRSEYAPHLDPHRSK